jgi:hypothetical protein
MKCRVLISSVVVQRVVGWFALHLPMLACNTAVLRSALDMFSTKSKPSENPSAFWLVGTVGRNHLPLTGRIVLRFLRRSIFALQSFRGCLQQTENEYSSDHLL